MALALPITFAMESLDAQNLLIGMYVGGVSGSMVSAILIGVPGTPAAVMTTFDGYPMAKQGLAAARVGAGAWRLIRGRDDFLAGACRPLGADRPNCHPVQRV